MHELMYRYQLLAQNATEEVFRFPVNVGGEFHSNVFEQRRISFETSDDNEYHATLWWHSDTARRH